MEGQELLTELKNLYSLWRYDDSKLGPTRTFSGVFMGKEPGKLPNLQRGNPFCSSPDSHIELKSGRYLQTNII